MRRIRLAAIAALAFLLVSLVPILPASAAPQPPTPSVVQYNAVQFIGSTGWAVGGFFSGGKEYAVITKTIDGGAHWGAPKAVDGPSAYFTSISMVSATVGYASCGAQTLYKTTNGGVSWTALPVTWDLMLQPFKLSSVDFFDATHGVATGRGAYNEPVTWSGNGATFSLGFDEARLEDTDGNPVNDGELVGVAMANTTNAIAVGGHNYPTSEALAFRTANGSTWTTQTLPALTAGAKLVSVAFPDTTHAYAVGTKGAAVRFNGSAWTSIPSGTTDLNAVATPDPTHALAVGPAGRIAGFDNGTSAWTARTSGTTANLRGIAFSSASVGVAVGDAGTIVRTVNGGSTWTVAAPLAPPVVTGLAASGLKTNAISLYWTPAPASSLLTGYRVERATAAAGPFTAIATVTTPYYTSGGLAANTAYYYRVRAVCGGLVSAPTAVAAARTLPVETITVQQDASGISSAGTWTTVTSTSLSGGSARRTTVAGSKITVPFRGTGVKLIATKSASAGKVDIIVNTPLGASSVEDGWAIRTAAVQHSVPCITTLSGATAAVEAIARQRAGAR
jgi:photosystem II stability/assembly factor-like uncharacterized protein